MNNPKRKPFKNTHFAKSLLNIGTSKPYPIGTTGYEIWRFFPIPSVPYITLRCVSVRKIGTDKCRNINYLD